jgi:hypothetical protein
MAAGDASDLSSRAGTRDAGAAMHTMARSRTRSDLLRLTGEVSAPKCRVLRVGAIGQRFTCGRVDKHDPVHKSSKKRKKAAFTGIAAP